MPRSTVERKRKEYEMPEITPDFNAPGMELIKQVAGWALGISLTLTVIALIFCIVSIAFKGFGNQGLQQTASKSLLWVIGAMILLAGLSGLVAFIFNIDLGLS